MKTEKAQCYNHITAQRERSQDGKIEGSNPKPSELEAALNVSVNHLNKVLKENTQCSTSEWVSNYIDYKILRKI